MVNYLVRFWLSQLMLTMTLDMVTSLASLNSWFVVVFRSVHLVLVRSRLPVILVYILCISMVKNLREIILRNPKSSFIFSVTGVYAGIRCWLIFGLAFLVTPDLIFTEKLLIECCVDLSSQLCLEHKTVN